jgi:acetyltransferase-like isoleucine patch superfamily enzyme
MHEHEFNQGIPANKFNPHCWIKGSPEIGEGTWIGAFTLIDGSGGLKIGRGCDISTGVQILSHSTVRRCVSERRYPSVDYSFTTIEDYVFIGTHATILMGAIIGHHSVIAAGAVVLEGSIIPPYSLVAGVPGKVIRSIQQEVSGWITQEQ